MIAATRPGRTIGAVFAVGEKAYAEAGFPDEWRHHHQGGSTGYVGREVRATPGNSTEILPNQPFAWNPSIAGTKSEDTILVKPGDNSILSFTGNWPTSRYLAAGWPTFGPISSPFESITSSVIRITKRNLHIRLARTWAIPACWPVSFSS